MKRLVCLLFLSTTLLAQMPQRPLRPVSTFSIVARDPQTGEIGVAVQSHWFAVGQIVPWAEAGVGAVATQSFVDPSYGKNGLELMRQGKTAVEALQELTKADKSSQVRQVAFVDANGNSAAFTGQNDIPAAGHIVGSLSGPARELLCLGGLSTPGREPVLHKRPCSFFQGGHNFSVQANLMSNDKVWPAMAKAFEETKGDLAERMLAALDAAQSVGGDIRGRQSAALIVVSRRSSGKPWEDRIFDLRVDDNVEPLKELRRLVALQRAYNHMNAGDLAVEHKDQEAALREYAAAEQIAETAEGIPASRLAEMRFWHAVALVNMKRVDESLSIFAKVFAGPAGANWRELVGRLPHSELLPNDPELIKRIQSAK
jgi:uncharacterized Ntn-hydrolase superfamily protein